MGRKKIKPERVNSSIDEMCDSVNSKYGLKPNSIGSIEHYHDMCDNAIVQICNENRGVRFLIYGTDKQLKQYLANILNDTVILYSL